MLPSSPLLRFKDLKRVGINNWPTLKRRVEKDGFPPGRYIGDNTRAWTEEEVTLGGITCRVQGRRLKM